MTNFASLLLYLFVSNFSAGPNTLLSLSKASKYGLKKSIPFNLGVAVGIFIIMLISGALSGILLAKIPWIKNVMRWLGAAYILWLAWGVLHSSLDNIEDAPQQKNLFLQGVKMQFVNLSVILYAINLFANYIVITDNRLLLTVVYSVLLGVIGFLATFTWSLFGAAFKKVILKHSKLINIILALMLLLCAYSLVK